MRLIIYVERRYGSDVDQRVADVQHVPRQGDRVYLKTLGHSAVVTRVDWDYDTDSVSVYTE